MGRAASELVALSGLPQWGQVADFVRISGAASNIAKTSLRRGESVAALGTTNVSRCRIQLSDLHLTRAHLTSRNARAAGHNPHCLAFDLPASLHFELSKAPS